MPAVSPSVRYRRVYISMRLPELRKEFDLARAELLDRIQQPKPPIRTPEAFKRNERIVYTRERIKDLRKEIAELRRELKTLR